MAETKSRPAVAVEFLCVPAGIQSSGTARVLSPPSHRITSSRETVERTCISGSSFAEAEKEPSPYRRTESLPAHTDTRLRPQVSISFQPWLFLARV